MCVTNEVTPVTATTTELLPNLIPEQWDLDIDMINSAGLQFEPQVAGDTFTVAITTNTLTDALVTFSVKVWYDPEILTVNGCEKSGAWIDKSYESNTESIAGQILLIGTELFFLVVRGVYLYAFNMRLLI